MQAIRVPRVWGINNALGADHRSIIPELATGRRCCAVAAKQYYSGATSRSAEELKLGYCCGSAISNMDGCVLCGVCEDVCVCVRGRVLLAVTV